jgi:hypothetical protein
VTANDDTDGEDVAPDEPVGVEAPVALPPPGQMLEKEQQTGFLVAGAIGVIVLILGITRQVHDSHSNSLLAAGAGVVAAAAMAYAAHRRKRMFAAIISVIGGLVLSAFFPLNFVFLLYGGWLMFKQSQAQKKLNKSGVRRTRPPRTRGETPASRRAQRRNAPADNRPKANRRYTPPKSTGSRTTKRSR